jgi:hypothetical protein
METTEYHGILLHPRQFQSLFDSVCVEILGKVG